MIDIWTAAQYVSLFIQREMELEGSTGEGLALLSRIGMSGPMTIREAATAMASDSNGRGGDRVNLNAGPGGKRLA
jgi:hypothetical protein